MDSGSSKKFQILSLSGGGYRGLHTAHILEIVEEKIQGRIAHHFDLIAGTSIGGIIALALALEIPAKTIRITLEELGPKLFPRTPPDFPHLRQVMSKSCVASMLAYALGNKSKLKKDAEDTKTAWYDPAPLADALRAADYFGTRRMADLSHPVLIPAVNYSDGSAKFFKTPHHSTFSFDGDLQLVDVALGTAAAPVYFPVHKVNDWRIVDGGLIANDPTQVSVHEAMMYFEVRPTLFGDPKTGADDLQILSIGTLSPKHFVDTSKPLNQGLLDWGAGMFELAGSAQEMMAAVMVDKHMLPGKVIRLPSIESRPEKAPGLADASKESTETLRSTARTTAQNAFGSQAFTDLFKHQGRTLAQVRATFKKEVV